MVAVKDEKEKEREREENRKGKFFVVKKGTGF